VCPRKVSHDGPLPVLPENAYGLIFLTFLREVVNQEFPAILAAKVNSEA